MHEQVLGVVIIRQQTPEFLHIFLIGEDLDLGTTRKWEIGLISNRMGWCPRTGGGQRLMNECVGKMPIIIILIIIKFTRLTVGRVKPLLDLHKTTYVPVML